MGGIAARTLIGRIDNSEPYVPEIIIEPEFVVRDSTAPARAHALQASGTFVRLRSHN